MKASFKELPLFERIRADYLTDETYQRLQQTLLKTPEAGDVIEGTGGLRKLRQADPRRGKGKRGGLRVIYYWWPSGSQFWFFTLYNKDEATDLSTKECKLLRKLLEKELTESERQQNLQNI